MTVTVYITGTKCLCSLLSLALSMLDYNHLGIWRTQQDMLSGASSIVHLQTLDYGSISLGQLVIDFSGIRTQSNEP